jgi:gluconate 2-dehydrogenase gamma chain
MGTRLQGRKKNCSDSQPAHPVSRRDVLAGTAATLACAFVPASSLLLAKTQASAGVLTVGERQSLEAIVSRLIPAEASGPGALEAGCARYIESALADAYQSLLKTYSAGLAALNSYAVSKWGKSFSTLTSADQDKALTDFEQNVKVADFSASSAFFEMVRRHTLEGMFGDPSYGGNQNFAGWDLIQYPGPKMYVPPQMQALDANPPRTRVSAKQLVHGSH